jgi:hypothetical protein
MTDQKKLNVHIDEGDTFYANEVSVNFNPTQFFMDFKNVSPRVDLRSKEGELFINIKHSVATFDPYHVIGYLLSFLKLQDIIILYLLMS